MMDYDFVQTITGIVGLIAIILLWWQIRTDIKWKKLNSSLDRIDLSLLDTNGKSISGFGINLEEERSINDEEYEKLIDEENSVVLYKVQDILDMFETFATLYNMNVLNKKIAYELYSESVIFYYLKFKKIIEFYRNKNDPFYYMNLDKCANSFLIIRQKEKDKFEKLQEKIKNKAIVFKDKLW